MDPTNPKKNHCPTLIKERRIHHSTMWSSNSQRKSLNFLMRSSKLLSLHAPLNSKNHINALIHLVTPRKHLFFLTQSNPKDFHIEGIDTPHKYYMLEQDVKNVYSMDTLEAANSMSDMEVNDEHESFILEEPQDTYSFEETPSPPAISTHPESSHPLPLY